jgi:hypothetical protein
MKLFLFPTNTETAIQKDRLNLKRKLFIQHVLKILPF